MQHKVLSVVDLADMFLLQMVRTLRSKTLNWQLTTTLLDRHMLVAADSPGGRPKFSRSVGTKVKHYVFVLLD